MATKNTKKRPTRRKTTRKKTVTRKTIARRPSRHKKASYRLAVWLGGRLAHVASSRRATVRARRDAAILRATHTGCTKCGGTGTLYTKAKDGSFAGSKPCPAKPAVTRVSRTRVAIESRFGPDKNSGLCGWSCPCGKREKPRYRDAKTATAALRQHERTRHGGTTVGGAWYAQVPAQTTTAPAAKPAPVSKTVASSGMTDKEWETQNKSMSPAAAAKKGLCWQCGGKGVLYTAFGGEQKVVVCGECSGSGKKAAAKTAGGAR